MISKSRKSVTLLLAMVYLFFACLYVVLCQRVQYFSANSSAINVHSTQFSVQKSKSSPLHNKFASRPRIVLNKKFILLPVNISMLVPRVFLRLTFTPLSIAFACFRVIKYSPQKLQPVFCSWLI